MEKAPEVAEIESLASTAGISIDDVLKRAGVATTTWWRWREGHFLPRLSTLRKVRSALNDEIALKDAA